MALRTIVIRATGSTYMYTEGHTVPHVGKLPLNLLDALRELEKSEVLVTALEGFVPSYLKLKMKEWSSFTGYLTDWERSATLDC